MQPPDQTVPTQAPGCSPTSTAMNERLAARQTARTAHSSTWLLVAARPPPHRAARCPVKGLTPSQSNSTLFRESPTTLSRAARCSKTRVPPCHEQPAARHHPSVPNSRTTTAPPTTTHSPPRAPPPTQTGCSFRPLSRATLTRIDEAARCSQPPPPLASSQLFKTTTPQSRAASCSQPPRAAVRRTKSETSSSSPTQSTSPVSAKCDPQADAHRSSIPLSSSLENNLRQ